MKRAGLLAIFLFLSLVSITWAQTTPNDEPLFVPLRQIGELRPRGILYDSNFDRFAWVDARQQLLLVDAVSLETQHVLYESGAYNAYKFSHDGRWLALAIDRRIELWDTQSGDRAAMFEPTGANLVQGPLHFTADDKYLLLDSVVPAPQETRRSENDTSIIPWLWDLEAGRGERSSRYASAEDGYAFFEYRNGLVIGANNILIGGIPNRLMVIDGSLRTPAVVAEIQANRFERDPIVVWQSAPDGLLYADSNANNGIVQVDTRTGTVYPLPLGRDLNYRTIAGLEGLQIARSGRELCPASPDTETSLLQLIYGSGYLSYQNFEPLTYMLLDMLEPMTMAPERGALLMYTFNQQRGRGSLELIRPQDIQQMLFTPDRSRLLVRRASGRQPLELYNLEDCTLERTIYPAELDGEGRHTLAFNADGSVIISDFQRFDTFTGATLAHEINYMQGFETLFFGEDSQSVVTIRAGEWQKWDIATGRPLETATIRFNGEIIRQSADTSRSLTRQDSEDGATMEIVDLRQNTRQTVTIPARPNQALQQIIPSDDWTNFLVVYDPAPAPYPTGNDLAVYSFEAGMRFYVAGDDLPAESYDYGWLDDRTIYAAGSRYGGQPERIYGIDYAPSGLPACLAEAFPDDTGRWVQLWESFGYRMRPDQLNRLAGRMCASLPAEADAVIPALTPTAPFAYRSNPTPLPYNIPGVPQCLTSRFSREATAYAALWREIAADLSEAERAELEVMICEGLIGSVGSVQPTPTINPNAQVPPTPTPIEGAPQTTSDSEYRPRVIAIDIETQQRSEGDYLPPRPQTVPPDPSLLYNFYTDQFRRSPNNLQISPDGQLAAELDANGFVVIYRLTRDYAALLADEMGAQATRQAEAARSIGLVPTATESFSGLGEIRPTLTPTITPTPPPLAEATPEGWQDGEIEEVCPSRQLFSLDDLPPDYAATGQLFTAPPAPPYTVWVLQPEDGRLAADDSLPRCILNEDCHYSFDRQWMVQMSADQAVISRPDGSQAVVIGDNRADLPYEYTWLPDNRLQFRYASYLPSEFRGQGEVAREYDPATGLFGEPFVPPDRQHQVEIGELQTSVVSNQPGGSLALVRTPYGVNGDKYYLYDRDTGETTYFARTEGGPINAYWHPLGHTLYYDVHDRTQYAYDVATGTHVQLPGGFPEGVWSPDGRYRMSWFGESSEEQRARIAAGGLPLKLERWDADTGVRRRYCLPETGTQGYGDHLVWSPDGRYVAFTIMLPINGDYFPTPGPTAVPYTPQPTWTPVPLDTQYDFQFARTVIFDTASGHATVVSTGISSLILWTDDGGAR